MKVAVTKENGAFAIEASEIKTKEDVQEVIRQLQLVEGQMVDGLGQFKIAEYSISDKIYSKGVLSIEFGINVNGFK